MDAWALNDNSGDEPVMIEMGRSMMTRHELGKAKDKDLVTSMAAMKRAAAMARKAAVQTDTAIVVVHGQQIVRVTADDLRKKGGA